MQTQATFFTFDKYWQILKRRWQPGLKVFVPVFLISVVALSLKKPTYESEAKILLQRTNTIPSLTGVGAEIGKLEALTEDNKTSPLNTEAEILRSAPLAQQTIDKLELKDAQGKPLNVNDFLKNLTVKDIKGSDIIQITYKDSNPEIAAQVVNTMTDVYLEHNVASRRKEAASARQFLQKELPNAESIVRKAEAELAIFKDRNKVVSLQEEATQAIGVVTDLQKQIDGSKSQIANINAQSEDLRQQLSMNSQRAVVMTSISQSSGVQDLLKEIQQLESQLAARRTVLRDDHPEIISSQDRLAALKKILQQRIQQVAGTNQPLVNGNLQIGALQQQLSGDLVRLQSTRLGLMNQVATLSKLQADYRQRLQTLPRLEQQQRQLERKVQASQSTYLLMLQKLQESQIAENQNIGNASLVSAALVPDKPLFSPMFSYLSAGLLATLAALVTMYILELRDKSIKTVDEAKELLGFTLLGVIPLFNQSRLSSLSQEEGELYSSRLVVRDMPRSPISEAYRMLRANLKFMSADKELKVIVVTSSVPGEGKSTIAANLALAMAQMERKVLLVDGDLHRPVQHLIWDLTNSQGLSNVIVGEAEIKTATNKVMDNMDNLDVLTAGVVPPSPASLLDSKRMASLMQNFAANYDFVIIDAPALNVAADAATLGQMADGVLFVVRPGVVDSVNAAMAYDILEKSGQNVLGQVVNAVIPQYESHSYYYFNEESDVPRTSLATTRR
ncbi:MAG: GumC family protein [Aulosira sp. ZfuVER01]|nr:polysaccharide biosynthesis tyrosine autokinase [Aulosira sp. ZfuVER01]MDZ7998042.1 polysaccharide biosynthesis tyrosine autokinase [Aulosira sp. DedVER01a]MDZ8050436.1 polysaccharide biosynthesis tyrosine autokinase [Aulosira sp. ZfuCHP01]